MLLVNLQHNRVIVPRGWRSRDELLRLGFREEAIILGPDDAVAFADV